MVDWFRRVWVRRTGLTLLFILVWLVALLYTGYIFFTESNGVKWDGQDEVTGGAPKPIILHIDFVYRGFDPSIERASFDLKASVNETAYELSEKTKLIERTDESVVNIILDGKSHAVLMDEAEQIHSSF
ncbi:hypothetical protein DSO57_1007286 [Entomophthora muscae]|uniref:Uncharacterized protein n=1 Tax=Entomophthora muscae TaxID=34485 RepID=A0ACC2USD9_9FUNG|nr:hypothetical protein DSO57_1007286 [Entomophthora muscae]